MNRVREASNRVGLGGNKRKADVSPKKVDAKKRSALGDVTNVSWTMIMPKCITNLF